MGQLSALPSVYEVGVIFIGLVCIAALLLMARAQQATLNQCREMREEMLRSERSRWQLNCLLIDLLATMNLSLAGLARGSTEETTRLLEQLRLAVAEAIQEQRRQTTSAATPDLPDLN